MKPITFKIKSAYTMVHISEESGTTVRNEIIIVDLDEKRGQYIFKQKGSKKLFYLPKHEELDQRIFFSGHNLPFVIDSETDRFMSNTQFNFVTDDPDSLREFIKTNCLNPSEEKFANILYSSTDRKPTDLSESPLFPPTNS